MGKLLNEDEYTVEAKIIFEKIDDLLKPFFIKYKETDYSMRELSEMVSSSARGIGLQTILARKYEERKK